MLTGQELLYADLVDFLKDIIQFRGDPDDDFYQHIFYGLENLIVHIIEDLRMPWEETITDIEFPMEDVVLEKLPCDLKTVLKLIYQVLQVAY